MSKIILNALDNETTSKLRDNLSLKISSAIKENKEIIILCVGTDRSTGDSLGPLVGEKLKFMKRKGITVLGTLENPIHAKNIEHTLNYINSNFKNPYIIAIDACLGTLENVGSVILQEQPIYPGAALNKNISPVGDISILGVVNITSSLDFLALQNTRLYTVMLLANAISSGLYHSIIKTLGGKKYSASIIDDVSNSIDVI